MTLALWIDPNDPSTVTTDHNGVVTQITDKSGTGNDLVSTGVGQLIINFDPKGSPDPDGLASPPGYTTDDYGRRKLTFSGDAQLDTAIKKFGTASLLLDGTDFCELEGSSDLHLEDKDFTLELWVYYSAAPNIETWLEMWQTATRQFLFGMNSSTSMQFAASYNGSAVNILMQRTWTPSPQQQNRWIHVAVTREGGTLRMYADGAQVGTDDTTISTNSLFRSTQNIGIGGRIDNTDGFTGNIDSVRFTIGKALYTGSTYTIPTEAFPTGPQDHLVDFADKSPGLQGLDTTNGFLRRINASPDAINMDGPDFTATVAIRDLALTPNLAEDQVIFGMTGLSSPVNGDGWRIEFKATSPETYKIVASIGNPNASPTQTIDVEFETSPSSSFALSGFAVITLQYDASAQYIQAFMNGDYIGAASFSGTLAFGHDVKLGGGDISSFSNGKILEAIYYDGFLPGDQIERLEGYMANKWGFADSLPSGHTYRYEGPRKVPAETVLAANFIANSDAVASPPGYTAETGQVADIFGGNANIDLDDFLFGGSSLALDGTGDYFRFADSADWDFGTGDFTVEVWVKFASTAGQQTIIGNWQNASTGWRIQWRTDTQNWEWREPGNTITMTAASSPHPETGRWYHIAVSRSGTDLRMFLDGVQIANVTNSNDISGSTRELYIGSTDNTQQYVNGNIDSVRVVKGRALYTRNFTPPTRGFEAPPPLAEFIGNFNGLDAAASPPAYTSEDQYAQVATFVGDAQLDTAQKRFGISSALFDGTGDRITFPQLSPSILDLGNEDFTLECSVRFNGDPGTANMVFMGKWGTSPLRSWVIGLFNNQLGFYYSTTGSDAPVLQTAWNPVGDQWYDIVVERFQNLLFFYVDGACLSVQALSATVYTAVTEFGVGANINSGVVSNPFNGWIDNVRVTPGTAVYKRAITHPQDYPYDKTEEDANSFLLPFNTFTRGSPDGATSPPIYQTEDNYAISLLYEGAEIDTAIRRMGRGSLRAAATTSDAELPLQSPDVYVTGSNDFTIEFWLYPTSLGGGNKIVYDHRDPSNGNYHTLYLTSGNVLYYFVNSANVIQGTRGFTVNTWHHILLERSGSSVRMFIDGSLDGANTTDTTTYLGGTNISLLDSGDESSGGVVGNIDGMRLNFTRAIYTGSVPIPTHPAGEPMIRRPR